MQSVFFPPFAVAGAAPIVVLILVFGVPLLLMWLWNITFPDVFGFKTVTYWQAFRLVLIAAILFGGARLL